MDDGSRRALRDLARRAEWRGQAGAAGAAQDAAALRELGAEMRAALARQAEQTASWGQQAIERLATYCIKARGDWTPEQIAELARLREDAVIALAPGPGESDVVTPEPSRRPARALPARLGALFGTGSGAGSGSDRRSGSDPRSGSGSNADSEPSSRSGPDSDPSSRSVPDSDSDSGSSRRVRPVTLVVIGCLVLIALILTLPHVLGGNSSANSASSTASATASAAAPPPTTTSPTASASGTATASAPASPSSSSTPTATMNPTTATPTHASTSHVTSIQISADPLSGNPPEVIISGTINASGTDDVTIDTTVDGITPSDAPPVDDSGQTSYNLTETINLSQWCGRGSVVVKVSSGAVSQSTPVSFSCSN